MMLGLPGMAGMGAGGMPCMPPAPGGGGGGIAPNPATMGGGGVAIELAAEVKTSQVL